MKNIFSLEKDGIYRLKVPFKSVYTSVFLIEASGKKILVDCAATAADVDLFIVPALKEMGLELSDIEALVLTHRHSDHAGGLSRVLSLFPSIEVITDIRQLSDGLYTYPMAGHTKDSIGVLDMRSHTLLSGDGLQGAGVGKFRCSIDDGSAYIETIEKIKNDENIENILFSHAYEPWYRDSIIGRRAIEECLLECVKYIKDEK